MIFKKKNCNSNHAAFVKSAQWPETMRDAADNWRGSERDEPGENSSLGTATRLVFCGKNVGGVLTELLYKFGKWVVVVLFQINQLLKIKQELLL